VALLARPSGPLEVFFSLIVYRHHQCYYSFSFCSTAEIRDGGFSIKKFEIENYLGSFV